MPQSLQAAPCRCWRLAPVARERRKTAASRARSTPLGRAEGWLRPGSQQRVGRLGFGQWRSGGSQTGRRMPVKCEALASPESLLASLSDILPFGEINLDFIASSLGYTMGAGSLLLFAPILLNLIRAKSSEGMSVSTWVLQVGSFSGITLYNLSKGYPISTFAEILYYEDRLDAKAILGVVVFFAACAFALWGLPPSAWTPVQVISSAIGVGALVPQILLNYRQGSSGNWSGITAGASTAGNGLRVFTTIQLTGDPVLIVGFAAGFLVNLILFSQIIYYSSAKDSAAAVPLQQEDEQKDS